MADGARDRPVKRPLDILWRMPQYASFLLKKPDLARKVIDHHLRASLLGKPLIRALEYGVTYRCQASCDKCSAAHMLDTTRAPLTRDQVRAVADESYRLGTYEVNFTGGEPLLDDDLEDVISLFHPGSTFIGINTNGALLDRRRIITLRDAGTDLLKISLDSPDSCEHDEIRGVPGLHDHIVGVLKVAREIRGIRAHICVVATRHAVESGGMGRTIELARQHGATLGIVFPAATGGWSQRHEVLLERHHREALDRLATAPSVFLQGNLGKGGFLCPCGTRELYVTCYGDVIPCPFIQIAFGNVLEEGLESIYHRMVDWRLTERRDVCASAEDPSFVQRYVDPLAGSTPLQHRDHPAWTGGPPTSAGARTSSG